MIGNPVQGDKQHFVPGFGQTLTRTNWSIGLKTKRQTDKQLVGKKCEEE